MKRLGYLVPALFLIGACASANPAPAPTPTPTAPPAAPPTAPPTADTPPPPPPAAPTPPTAASAADNWQLLDSATDGVMGASVERAYRELLAGRQPGRTVVVAVLDGGVDTAHVDLRANLWVNEDEVPGNGQDDDGNGYIDDVHGWNFLGGPDGRSVNEDRLEVTRLYARCTNGNVELSQAERAECPAITSAFEQEREETTQTLMQIRMIGGALNQAVSMLRGSLGDSLTVERVTAFRTLNPDMQRARSIYLDLAANGLTPEELADAEDAYGGLSEYGLNPDFDPRGIVGDDYGNLNERDYGNNDVMGPDADHGTHVAGIIGAIRGNGEGIDGIASAVRIMSVRTVPDGDEHDKDVANAIRYAAENGADIINMSFGKGYSPGKSAVDEAVRFAESRGVLMIHAAGNDAEDVGIEASFPTRNYLDGGAAANWIEVGASSWQGGDSLAASFSNYGRDRVDLFAPGVDVLSTKPGSIYEREDGTSMAAPVVSGVAALLMAYFPDLTAADVKRILLESATRVGDQSVVRPGSMAGEMVPFSSLSVTGGVVNAYEAIRMAQARTRD